MLVNVVVLYDKLVEDFVVRVPAELLSDSPVLGDWDRTLTHLLGVDVGSLDNERIALIPADRVAKPLLEWHGPSIGSSLFWGVKDRDDACIVHHLDQYHDVIIGLHELIGVVIERAHHSRAGLISKPKQATLCVRESLRAAIVSDTCRIAIAKVCPIEVILRIFSPGDPPAWRIHYVRSSELPLDECQIRTRADPKIVVGPGAEVVCSRLGGIVHPISLIQASLDARDRGHGCYSACPLWCDY